MSDRRIAIIVGCWCALLMAWAPLARADYLVMRDGSTRQGTVVSRTADTVMIRMGEEGFQMTVSVAMADISEVHIGANIEKPHAATQPLLVSVPAIAPAAATQPLTPDHFFREWLLLGLGSAADPYDPETLPPDQDKLWGQSLQDNASGNKPAELLDLNLLMKRPNVDMRLLNKFSIRRHQVLFGVWLGQLRWGQMKDNYHVGQFDLDDVTPIETPTLIGLLRSATEESLIPVRPYYPLPPALAELPKTSRPVDPLLTIPLQAAETVRAHAFYALAVLSAQIKLEPNMPANDRAVMLQQAANVHAVIIKCNELIPIAQAEAAKAQRAKELQDAQKLRSGQ